MNYCISQVIFLFLFLSYFCAAFFSLPSGHQNNNNSTLILSYKMKKVICSEKAPGAIGPYSQAIEANGMIFVSGQLPINAVTGAMPEGVEAQTKQSLENMQHILKEAGLTMANIVKTTVFLQDMSLFAGMNGVYATFFDGAFPARSAFAVKALPKDALVEIECIAAR